MSTKGPGLAVNSVKYKRRQVLFLHKLVGCVLILVSLPTLIQAADIVKETNGSMNAAETKTTFNSNNTTDSSEINVTEQGDNNSGHQGTQGDSNMCDVDNGGCEHQCNSSAALVETRCSCTEGHLLIKGTLCVEPGYKAEPHNDHVMDVAPMTVIFSLLAIAIVVAVVMVIYGSLNLYKEKEYTSWDAVHYMSYNSIVSAL